MPDREPPGWLDEPSPPGLLDALSCPDDVAAALAVGLPGPNGAAALAAVDPQRLSDAGRIDLLVALGRQIASLQAARQRALAAITEHAGDPRRDGVDAVERLRRGWVREDVACALRVGPGQARAALAVGHELATRLAGTLTALAAGRITDQQAVILAEAVSGLDDEATTTVEERVLGRAPEQSIAAFRSSVARAVAASDPERVRRQRADAMAERRVCFTPRPDGMSELWALLPAEGAAAIEAAVNALASVTSADDPRTLDQRRADALVDLGVAALHDPALPCQHGLRPNVQVTVALSTLLGLDEQPGELAGHGPIPASVARHLAGDETGTWRRLVTDPLTGALLEYGRTTYRPPRDLGDFVTARDGTCRFPGCQRDARRGDLDHTVPWEAGGSTGPHNLTALCRRHHVMKHQAGWSYTNRPDGSTSWTSPTGHRYRSRSADLPRDTTVDAQDPPPGSPPNDEPAPF